MSPQVSKIDNIVHVVALVVINLFAGDHNFHWQSIENRRDFFDEIAVFHKFDALVPDNWYLITDHAVRSASVSRFHLFVFIPDPHPTKVFIPGYQ